MATLADGGGVRLPSPMPISETVASLRILLGQLRLALPATLITLLLVRMVTYAFLSAMDRIQSAGTDRPSWATDDDDDPWDTPADAAEPITTGEGEEDDGDAVMPVVVRVKAMRRSLVLSLFGVVALTYFGEGAVQIIATIVTNIYTPSLPLSTNIVPYATGGIAAFVLCALSMMYDEKISGKVGGWGGIYPRLFAVLSSTGEVAVLIILARLIALDPEARPSVSPLPAISIGILSFRLLLLIFLVLSQTPFLYKSTFEPIKASDNIDESTSLLSGNIGTDYGGVNGGPLKGAKQKSMLRPSKPVSNRPPDPKSLSLWTLVTRVQSLFPYLWPSKSIALQFLALLCFALMLLKRVINVAEPIYFGRVIQDLSDGQLPYVNIAIYIVVRFIADSQYTLQNYLWLPIQQYTEREMTMMSFETLLNLSLAYHTKRKTGELLRILDRSEAINDFFETLIFTFLPICIDLPVAVVVLWVRYGSLIVAIVIGISSIFVTSSVVLSQSRTKLRRKLRDAGQYMRQIQADTLMNWETAKIFTAERFESSRLRDAVRVYQKGYFRIYGMWNSLALIQSAVSSLGLLICSFVLAHRVANGEMKVGNYVTFVSFLGGLYGPLNRIASLYRQVMSNLVDTEQLMDLLKEPRDIVDRPGAVDLDAKGGIEFKDVHFAYDGKNETIKGISFKILPGQSVALVGPSGGGKSTVMRLIYRFYDVSEGSIMVDGQDIRDITQHSLRGAIGLVPQDSVLFNETLRYNIAYGGGPDVTEQQIVQAAVAAQMHERILTFPQKYETRVGERGQRLSGGEKQRVAIARVLLKNPPLLLLDEATSALDTTNERAIQARLRDLSKGRTTLSIAHRLSTIVDSDVILVLNDGVIAESGTHFELLAKEGLYAELWQKQIEGEQSMPGTGAATPTKSADDSGSESD